MLAGSFHAKINPSTYKPVQSFETHGHQRVITARNQTNHSEQVALRLRVGRTGYSQWLNELYVYLLPNFGHKNILPLLGYDKRLLDEKNKQVFNSKVLSDKNEDNDDDDDQDDYDDDNNDQQRVKSRSGPSRCTKATIEYWLVNSYSGCITLKHYLMMHTLSWSEMISIAHGIMCGLHYLHDNAEYTCASPVDKARSVDGFIRSTRGAIRKAAFKDSTGVLHLKPPLDITIIHRNLCSLNIVLAANFEPRIWNFGFAYVYHPFQPINFDHYVDAPIKDVLMTSPYSPPEVLSERTYFTHQALKSHDMYSCGVLFYELIARCRLPPVDGALPEHNMERLDPLPYAEPFAPEFLHPKQGFNRDMLAAAVCRFRCRPALRSCWLVGKKSNRFVQLFRELWDQDSEARLHCCTAIDRLERMSRQPHDKPNRYPPASMEREFEYDRMWPPEEECHQAPRGAKLKEDNIIYESLEDLKILSTQMATAAAAAAAAATATTTAAAVTTLGSDSSY